MIIARLFARIHVPTSLGTIPPTSPMTIMMATTAHGEHSTMLRDRSRLPVQKGTLTL